jgi:hypothetical protein
MTNTVSTMCATTATIGWRLARRMALASVAIFAVVLPFAGCEGADPEVRGSLDGGNVVSSDSGAACATEREPLPVAPAASCARPTTDFDPANTAGDGWPACVSDGNVYVPFEANVSALSRVAAFEQIRALLGFGTAKVASPDDFLQARVLYSQDQGIESRVARREDEHYPPATKLCRDMNEQELAANRDRCVGPAVLRPLLNDAFTKGIAGEAPSLQAARVEAALLSWLYFSIFKEATSARDAAKDVDSMWAKYSGGIAREAATHVGLARYVRALSPETHERIYDGLLAVRCWRDLDNPTGVASNTALQIKARDQLERALLRGIALVVMQRAEAASECRTASETVRILGGFLVREAKTRDLAKGDRLQSAIAAGPINVADVRALLGDLFPCP